MWLVMRGAMAARIRCLHRTYYLPSMAGIGTAIYENSRSRRRSTRAPRRARHDGTQLAGIEKLAGTYPFDFARSVKAYRLNDFLHRMVEPGASRAFPRRSGSRLRGGRAQRRGARPHPAPRLARHDPLRRDLLHARKARRGSRRVEPAHLRRDARRVAGGIPEDAQRAGSAVLGGRHRRQGPRQENPHERRCIHGTGTPHRDLRNALRVTLIGYGEVGTHLRPGAAAAGLLRSPPTTSCRQTRAACDNARSRARGGVVPIAPGRRRSARRRSRHQRGDRDADARRRASAARRCTRAHSTSTSIRHRRKPSANAARGSTARQAAATSRWPS